MFDFFSLLSVASTSSDGILFYVQNTKAEKREQCKEEAESL